MLEAAQFQAFLAQQASSQTMPGFNSTRANSFQSAVPFVSNITRGAAAAMLPSSSTTYVSASACLVGGLPVPGGGRMPDHRKPLMRAELAAGMQRCAFFSCLKILVTGQDSCSCGARRLGHNKCG